MDDTVPLFGEESKGEKLITWAVIGILGIWAVFCIGIGIAFGIKKDVANILLAICIIITTVATILMWRWWRTEDLDPKFRLIIALLAALMLMQGIAMNVYVWPEHRSACLNPCEDSGFLNPMWYRLPNGTGVCFEQCYAGQCRDLQGGDPSVCVTAGQGANRTATVTYARNHAKWNPFKE